MYSRKISIPLALGSCLLLLITSCQITAPKKVSIDHYETWSSYLGDPGRSHFTTLSQITPENVQDLKVAWTYEAQDWGQMQMNPLVVDSMVYGVTGRIAGGSLACQNRKRNLAIRRFGKSLAFYQSRHFILEKGQGSAYSLYERV